MKISYEKKIYYNQGNSALLQLVPVTQIAANIIDIGFGNGANTVELKKRFKDAKYFGITLSHSELEKFGPHFDHVFLEDIETFNTTAIEGLKFDIIIFSHILEHLKEPEVVLKKFLEFLNFGGIILIAVPNILNFRKRIDFAFGNWQYTETGILDKTHLRFFTYYNIDSVLNLKHLNEDYIINKAVETRLPLINRLKRTYLESLINYLERSSSFSFPNLFGWQILVSIKKIQRADPTL